jgi:hypothetical protein
MGIITDVNRSKRASPTDSFRSNFMYTTANNDASTHKRSYLFEYIDRGMYNFFYFIQKKNMLTKQTLVLYDIEKKHMRDVIIIYYYAWMIYKRCADECLWVGYRYTYIWVIFRQNNGSGSPNWYFLKFLEESRQIFESAQQFKNSSLAFQPGSWHLDERYTTKNLKFWNSVEF